MRLVLLFIFSLCFFQNCFAQTKHQGKKSLKDTAFTVVPLQPLVTKRILIFEAGQKARIFLAGDSLIKQTTQLSSTDFEKKSSTKIKLFLDSAFMASDTVSISFKELYRLPDLMFCISGQLQKGNAKVFYKRQNIFVDTIIHRLERYGGHADRFFYLPDQRPFFCNRIDRIS